ncbi:hypothetical protein WDW37_18765 [Bdellovibrionota bacterium FG-1]
MKKVSQMVLVVGLMVVTVGLSACGGASSNGTGAVSGESQSLATFTEQELGADLANLDGKEKGLESAGMRFQTSVDSVSSIAQCSWDPEAFTTAFKNNPALTQADMVKALQEYLDAANAYLKKYDGVFTFKKSDGSTETVSLKDPAKSKIKAKVDLSTRSLDKLKKG